MKESVLTEIDRTKNLKFILYYNAIGSTIEMYKSDLNNGLISWVQT